ncbi:lysostaphin resistance A-like protein [Halorubrum sp. DTA98]|uniref:CPBP family intramembrane glutamic endopeptidase n=1 Tax=Halorubrum sp. DTA98 TaxID=3402163 RepID=UPI003AAC27FA
MSGGPEDGTGNEADGGSTPLDAVGTPIEELARLASAAFAVVFALVVASAITAPVTGIAVDLGVVTEETNAWQVLRTVVQFGGFLLAALGYLAITGEWDVVGIERPTLTDAGLVVVVGLALLVLQYGALFVLGRFGVTTGQNTATVAAGDPASYYLAMIVVSLLVVGPVEELLFRGVVQGGLRRTFDALPAILIASLLFGIVHLPAVDGSSLEQLAYVGVVVGLGCLLGFLYERTNNVLVPGLAHGAYNAAIYAFLLVGVA